MLEEKWLMPLPADDGYFTAISFCPLLATLPEALHVTMACQKSDVNS